MTDPSLAPSFDGSKFTAHLITWSSEADARPAAALVKPMTERVFIVDGPGEYEVGGVLINGVRTYRDDAKGAEAGRNTVYVIHLDEFTFCHLGDLGHTLTAHQLEEIGSVDVLFVPASSHLAANKLTEVISEIEPRLVVPMYDTGEQLDKVAHELGIKEWTPQEKLTVTAATLPPEGSEMHVVVLQQLSKL